MNPSFQDGSLARLLLLLEDEVKSSGISGALYAEHLAHALATRLFTLANGDIHEKSRRTVGNVPSKVLSQLLDRIEANPVRDLILQVWQKSTATAIVDFSVISVQARDFLHTNTSRGNDSSAQND